MKTTTSRVDTTPLYWDCECEKNYIHRKDSRPQEQQFCERCGMSASDCPDSRVTEVRRMHDQGTITQHH